MRGLLARVIPMLNRKDPTSLRTFVAASFASQSESELSNSVGRLSLGATGDTTALTNALAGSIGALLRFRDGPCNTFDLSRQKGL